VRGGYGTSVDLFVRGANGAIYWKHSNDGTTWPSTSVDLGGYATSDPAAVVWSEPAASYTAVFVRGGDGALWERFTSNGGTTWSSWYSLGGQLLAGTGPAACSWIAGTSCSVGAFVIGTDHALWWKNLGGTSWASLGGYLTSSPAAVSLGNGNAYVFARGGDNFLWEGAYINNIWTWASVGGI